MTISIYDAVIRQQAYVEGVVNSYSTQARRTETVIKEELMKVLFEQDFSSLPLTAFNRLIIRLTSSLVEVFNDLVRDAQNTYKSFVKQDVRLTYELTKTLVGFDEDKPFISDNIVTKSLKEPIQATGETVSGTLNVFTTFAVNSILSLLRSKYAEKATPDNIAKALFGTATNHGKDGLLAKIGRKYTASLRTILTFGHQWVSSQWWSLFTDRYQWVSILDSRTTEYCQAHDGRIYYYGKGPIPPAHYQCRSTTVPLFPPERKKYPVSVGLFAWVLKQPIAIQEDLLGTSRARRMRNGYPTTGDTANPLTVLPLTINQYGKLLPKLLTE